MRHWRRTIRAHKRSRHGTKATAQKCHAKRRFCQRLGANLSDEDYRNLIQQIQSGKAKFLEKQSNRVSLFQINIDEEPAVAVYDKNTNRITTFLTIGMYEERYGKLSEDKEDIIEDEE